VDSLQPLRRRRRGAEEAAENDREKLTVGSLAQIAHIPRQDRIYSADLLQLCIWKVDTHAGIADFPFRARPQMFSKSELSLIVLLILILSA
jgi:hypothetical protein